MKTRAGCYARVSTEEQVERDTIENQIDYLHGYCELNDYELHEIYQDPGVSGTVPVAMRPNGSRLLADAAAGKFDVVIVYRLDRLARKVLVLAEAVEELRGRGVRFISASEGFDTETPMGRAMMNFLAMFAEWEREAILDRTFSARVRSALAGKWPGGPTPCGYRVGPDGFLEVCPEEEEIVRRAFDLAEFTSMKGICRLFTEEGIPTASARRGHKNAATAWNVTGLHGILRNTIYVGDGAAWRKAIWKVDNEGRNKKLGARPIEEHLELQAPALISREQFDRVQEALDDRSTHGARMHGNYPLSGLLLCQCGEPLYGGGAQQRYYTCAGQHGVVPNGCRMPRVRADHWTPIVMVHLRRLIEQPQILLENARLVVEAYLHEQAPPEEQRRSLQEQLRLHEQRHDNVVTMFRDGDITKEKSRVLFDEIELARRSLQKDLDGVTSADERHERVLTKLTQLYSYLSEVRDRLDDHLVLRTACRRLHLTAQLGLRQTGEPLPEKPKPADAAVTVRADLDALVAELLAA